MRSKQATLGWITLALLGGSAYLFRGSAGSGGCGGGVRDVAPDDEARTILLDQESFASLSVPADSRGGEAPPEKISLKHWTTGSEEGAAAAVTDLPIRTRNLYFFKPSPGMRVLRKVGETYEELPHHYLKSQPPYWTYDETHLRIHGWDGLPKEGELFLEYPSATTLENTLNKAWSGKKDDAEFVRATVQAGPESRSGMLLPAPSDATWDLEIPPSADLRFATALIRPEIIDGPPSDGAEVRVTFSHDGKDDVVWQGKVKDDTFQQVRVDLKELAHKRGRLRIQTLPGAANDAHFDYVFLADPVIASRKAHPKRVFLVFVDTLRVDHVSAFGYERQTTPALDALAASGARFTQARNVAPWTLPSTRSVLTGEDPEYYYDRPTLQGKLREAGFATAMFAGNLYLSANFGLNRDWGMHYVELLPRAKSQLDRALAWLDENGDRDMMMLVHLMDAHLPYKEPDDYRRLFAGDPPETLKREEFHRDHLVAAHLKTKEDRQYVRDRYDNNVRYADDQLARLYERLGPDDIVVFFSDHGEEFWDHGGLEHGHTLFDELLHVPLVVKGPGIEAGAVDQPVSLLDVAPTVLDMLGLEASGMKGRSLVALAGGDASARTYFEGRPQAFGRPLYGGERWGVIDGDQKYTTFNGGESIFDLAADPLERKDLQDNHPDKVPPMREALHKALDREVVEAWRIAPKNSRRFPEHDLVATVTVPAGIRAAWVGEDPTDASSAELVWKEGDKTATITWPKAWRGSRDVWVVPTGPIAAATPGLVIDAVEGDGKAHLTPAADSPTSPHGERGAIFSGQVGERTIDVGFGIMPIPDPKARHLSGSDPALVQQLKAMGYLVGGPEEDEGKKDAPKPETPKPGGEKPGGTKPDEKQPAKKPED